MKKQLLKLAILAIVFGTLLGQAAGSSTFEVEVKDQSDIPRTMDQVCVEHTSSDYRECETGQSTPEFQIPEIGYNEEYTFSVTDDDYQDKSGTTTVWKDGQTHFTRVKEISDSSEEPEKEKSYNFNLQIEDYDGNSVSTYKTCLEHESSNYRECKYRASSPSFEVPETGNDQTYYFEISDSDLKNKRESITIWKDDQTHITRVESSQTEEDSSPQARFSVSDSSPKEGQWVDFDASSSDGDIESYRWNFGDVDTYTDNDPYVRHRYNNEGTYTAKLTVEEHDGDTDSTTKTIHVDEKTDPNNSPEISLQRPAHGSNIRLPYTFRWDASDPDGDSVDSTIYIGESRSDESTLDDSYVLKEDVGSDENFRLSSSELAAGDYIWGVETTDEHGATTRSSVRSFTVTEETQQDRGTLRVFVKDSSNNPVNGAKVQLDDPNQLYDYTDNSGETRRFDLDTGSYDVTVSRHGYETETVATHVSNSENEYLTVILGDSETDSGSDQARLDVHVEDRGYDELEDVRVEVENGDRKTRYTNNNGDVRFYLESDVYDIEVECNGEEVSREVYLSQGEKETIDLRFNEDFGLDRCGEDGNTDDSVDEPPEDGLAITEVNYPNSVCRGGSFSADVEIENRGGFHEIVTVTGSGLGSINIGESFSLDIAQTKHTNIRFTDVEGSGNEEFKVTATNHDSDQVERTINVRDCGPLPDPDYDYGSTAPTDITADISPEKTVVGKTVKIKGYVDGVRGRAPVTITANGERKASISTEPDGYYSTFIRVNEVGENIIRVRSGQSETSGVVNIVPTSTVSGIKAPNKVFESESFEVCAKIDSQIKPKVFLLRDGSVVDSKFGKGNVCFNREASGPGEHEFRVKALTYGKESSSTTETVNILELGNEVTNFPDQVATTESEEGMVKVELYNTNNETRRYKVKLNGIRTDWLSQSQEDVILTKGERETVYFYLTPKDEGTFEPIVTVVSEDTTIYSEEVSVYAGGTKKPQRTSVLNRLTQIFKF